MKKTAKKTADAFLRFLPLGILMLFLAVGLLAFRDYGATPDEKAQIEAGHIYWRHIAQTFNLPTPEFESLPPLEAYYNRYYGQAATFPTVLIEALYGFSLDSSTLIRLRHLWNFLCYFAGMCAFAWLLRKRFRDERVTALALVCMILMPRFFSDAFGNDRDTLFCAWLWISLASFQFFDERPSVFRSFLCGLSFALCTGVRYFGFMLLIPLGIWFVRAEKQDRRYGVFLLFFWLLFAYLFTPLAWKSPVKTVTDALVNFIGGSQRKNETNSTATQLYMGKDVLETHVPRSYIPVWMLITIPPMQFLLALLGTFSRRKNAERKHFDIDFVMALLFILGTAAVIWSRPVLYNAWRHFYWLFLPVVWFAARGISDLVLLPRKKLRMILVSFVLLNLGGTAFRMVQEHPYEALYFVPWMRSRAAETFDRDYWRLSTPECLRFILSDTSDELIQLGEYNGSIDNVFVGMFPQERNRFLLENVFSPHRETAEYLVFNYSNFRGNEKRIPFYESVYSVVRDGFKLAEVFRRDHSQELLTSAAVKFVSASSHDEDAYRVVDGDHTSAWHGTEEPWGTDELRIELNGAYDLAGLTLLPGSDEREYPRELMIEVSSDGEQWRTVPYEAFGLLDFIFQESFPDGVSFLRIQNHRNKEFGWSVKELVLYGKEIP